MRFIGEFIQEFTSRFRAPVFLEDTSMRIQNTAASANAEKLQLYKTFGSGTNGDFEVGNNIGQIDWLAVNSNLPIDGIAQITAQVEAIGNDPTGAIRLRVGSKSLAPNSLLIDALKLKGDAVNQFRVYADLLNDYSHGLCTIKGDTLITTGGTALGAATSIPKLSIENNTSGGGSNDSSCGLINFRAKDNFSSPSLHDFAQIQGKSKVAGVDANSFKQGELSLNVLSNNSFATGLKIEAINGVAGATEVTIGSSTTSKVNIIGDDFEVPDLTIKDPNPVLKLHDSSTTVTQGNLIGQVVWHNSENNSDTLKIIGQAAQSFSSSAGGSKFQFWVTQANSTTPWRALTIENDRSLDCANNVTIDGTGNLILKQNESPVGQYSTTFNVPALASDITLTTPTTTGTLALTSSDITGNAATASSAISAGIAKNVIGNTNTDVNISSEKNVIVTIDSDNDSNQTFKVNNSAGTLFSVNETGSINFSGTAITNVNTGAAQLDIQTDGNVNFTIDRGNNSTGNYFSFINYNQEIARLDESGNLRLEGTQLSNSATASNLDIISSRVLKLQHAGAFDIELGNSTNQDVLKVEGNSETVTVNGALNTTGLITGKQRQVYSQSFLDDLGTTKHYLPWKDINEQLQIYQEEAAMLMPCDGRIVSVSVRVQFPNADGDITIGVHTCPVNVSSFVNQFTDNWIEEETEQMSLVNADDNHLFHFTFDNAKHFESSELCAISIQCSQDISGTAYWHISTVVEYDWSTFLGTTSVEIDSTP